MKRKDFIDITPGTPLLVGSAFKDGSDDSSCDDIRHLLNGIITFDRLNGDWVHHKEVPQTPFHISELVGVFVLQDLDKDKEAYELGDMGIIFGEV